MVVPMDCYLAICSICIIIKKKGESRERRHMKSIKKISIICVIIMIIVLSGCTNSNIENDNDGLIQEKNVDKNSIAYTGWLKTEGAKLLNEKGEPIQLRGLSSHGIQWFPEVITYGNLKELKENWNINVFRIAMYTDPNTNGYIAHPQESKDEVNRIVEYAKALDMYVIIDWHILHDNNPQTYQKESIEFFDEMSKKYADVPNVIYEICNEPNGYDVIWDRNVKPYAEEVVKAIRANCPKSLIIVGTPDWCKSLKEVANNPLNYNNIAYSCHFYAGSHEGVLQSEIDYCIEQNIPVFVSECGITNATGNGAIYADKYRAWINFLNERNISYIYWSFSNKDESSSILTPEYSPKMPQNSIELDNSELNNNDVGNSDVEKNQDEIDSGELESVDINDYLTESGKVIKEILTTRSI